MLKEAFGEQALSQARTFEWLKRFKDGRESVEDDKHSGRPSTCTTPEMIAKVREVILEDRRKTIHDVCNRVGLSYGSCQRILADELNMRRINSAGILCTRDRLVAENNIQHSQETDTHATRGIRTRNPSKRAVADPSFRRRGHRYQP